LPVRAFHPIELFARAYGLADYAAPATRRA
jgi:hypothetical protein